MRPTKAFDGKQQSGLRRWERGLEGHVRRFVRPARDAVQNWRYVRADRRIAVVRDHHGCPSYYRDFLHWIAQELPEVRSLLELRLLPRPIRDWSPYALIVPWLPDTLLYRSSRARRQALRLVADADAHGVPVINRPERLLSTSKHDCARRMARLGVRTPAIRHIDDVQGFKQDLGGMDPPLLVREDLAHGGRSPVYLVQKPSDAQRIPLEQFERPIAVEFIDVRSPYDGLVRKYRYMVVGEIGIAHTLQISRHWEVRSGKRLLNAATAAEEIAYTDAPDPNHELLQRIRRALGLDFFAFDYSLDHQGQLVIWEINIMPGLGLPSASGREHLHPPVKRAMAATVKMYLQRAGMEVPAKVDDLLAVRPRGVNQMQPGIAGTVKTAGHGLWPREQAAAS